MTWSSFPTLVLCLFSLSHVLYATLFSDLTEESCGFLSDSIRSKRSLSDRDEVDIAADSLGNPSGKKWECPPGTEGQCTFTMPVTISIKSPWHKTKTISEERQRQIIFEGCQKWAAWTATLSIAWAPPGQKGNIEVFFAFIDSKHMKIALASEPAPHLGDQATFIRFDDVEDWTEDGSEETGAYSLKYAALHECGHALGLRHSNNSNDIMYGKIQRTASELSAGDVAAIQALYGASGLIPPGSAQPPPPVPPFVPTHPHVVPLPNPAPVFPPPPNPVLPPPNPGVHPTNHGFPPPNPGANVRPFGSVPSGFNVPQQGVIVSNTHIFPGEFGGAFPPLRNNGRRRQGRRNRGNRKRKGERRKGKGLVDKVKDEVDKLTKKALNKARRKRL